MNVNLIVLVNNIVLISQIEKVSVIEIGDPEYKLIEPFIVNYSDETLSPWLLDFTIQNKFRIGSDKIITMAEPKPTLLEKYQSLIK